MHFLNFKFLPVLVFVLNFDLIISTREGKVLSLFNIVSFDNVACASSATLRGNQRRSGTCLTLSECTNAKGTGEGSCAAGFGVCCTFSYQETATINQNNTYLQNPGYPTPYSETDSITYTIEKCSNDVCSLRLDFESFNILGTGNEEELDGGVCLDDMTITTTSGQRIPVICGVNSGSHIYVELGGDNSASATVAMNFNSTVLGTSTNRNWDIKVAQIPCGADYAAPNGCLQYLTGGSGRITTFNFDATGETHLAEQQYSVCIRKESGFCCVQYQVCPDAMDTGFTLNTGAADTMAHTDSLCSLDYVGISGSSNQCQQSNSQNLATDSKYCGLKLNNVEGLEVNAPVCDCTAPFIVDIYTDVAADDGTASTPNTMPSRGVCLDFYQVPCSG